MIESIKLYFSSTFIVKAASSCEGRFDHLLIFSLINFIIRGIFLLKSENLLEILDRKKEQELPINGVVQEYLESPLLISGQKFDLRLYVLIQSCDPLSIYLFKVDSSDILVDI